MEIGLFQKPKDGFLQFLRIDQAHEQENKIVKGEGGAVGLMDGLWP